jgi:hypothetical protein
MRIFRSVVTPLPTFIEVRDSKIATSCPVRPQIVGHQLIWHKIQLLQQFPHPEMEKWWPIIKAAGIKAE